MAKNWLIFAAVEVFIKDAKSMFKKKFIHSKRMKQTRGGLTMAKIVKGLIALAMMLVFILSVVPFVAADENGKSGDGSDVKEVDAKEVKAEREGKQDKDVRKELKLESAGKEDRPKAEKNSTVLEVKEKLKEKIDAARDERKEGREKYKEARDEYKENKDELKDLKEKSRDCKNDSADCKEKQVNYKKGIKQHLLHTVDVIRRSLEQLQERVTESKVLSEEDKTNALQTIADLEKNLTVEQDKVNALVENATAADLRKAIQDLKHLWQDVRKEQRQIIASLTSSKQDNIIEKHGEFTNGMEARIAELKEKGINVSALEQILAKFKEQTAQMKADQEKARSILKDVRGGRDDVDTWHDAQEVVREDLKKTRETLREFLAKYKELKGTLKGGNVTSEE